MVDVFVVPVFHHGGSFVRNSNGSLVYRNGKVEKFPEMDLNFLNFGDLITLFKGLGYQSYRVVYWYDPMSDDIESGLHSLTGNAEINAIRENKMKNTKTNEFYLYFDHPVDEHEIVEDVGNKGKSHVLEEIQSSSSDDGYESTEDEPYKSPPPGYETNSDDGDNSAEDRARKRKRVSKGKKKIVSSRMPSAKKPCAKKPAAKKTGVNRNRRSWLKKGQSSGIGTSEVNRRQQPRSEPNIQ